jgi:hypothetical protein
MTRWPAPSDSIAAAPPRAAPALDTRAAIGIARVLCILGIVYVHAWTGRDGDTLIRMAHTAQGTLRWVLIELVGRSAVPLLGAISGWLVAASAARRGYAGFAQVKARTIFLPMLLWNVIAMALVSGFARWGHLAAPIPEGPREALDWLLCATQANPINVQISFLRDLFLCMLAAPLLARLPTRALIAVGAVAMLWDVSGVNLYLLLRPQILVFFVAGMLAKRTGFAERIGGWPLAWAVAPYILLVVPKILISVRYEPWLLAHVAAADAIDLPLRFAAAIAVWRIALALAERPAGRLVLRGERYAFLLFCSHLVFIWLLGPVIGLATGRLGSPLYTPYLLLQPILVLAPTVLLGRLLERATPRAANLLSGGRLAQPGAKPRLNRAAPSVMEPAV